MARSNSFTLRGFVGRDAETRATSTGRALAQFSICISERWQAADGQAVEKAQWFRITCWGRQAEIAARRVSKGALLEVHGRLEARSWKGANDQTHYATDLVATELVFIDNTTGQPFAVQPVGDSALADEPAEAPAETPEPAPEAEEQPPAKRRRRVKSA
jgi:single-strand DNA-binding protein